MAIIEQYLNLIWLLKMLLVGGLVAGASGDQQGGGCVVCILALY